MRLTSQPQGSFATSLKVQVSWVHTKRRHVFMKRKKASCLWVIRHRASVRLSLPGNRQKWSMSSLHLPQQQNWAETLVHVEVSSKLKIKSQHSWRLLTTWRCSTQSTRSNKPLCTVVYKFRTLLTQCSKTNRDTTEIRLTSPTTHSSWRILHFSSEINSNATKTKSVNRSQFLVVTIRPSYLRSLATTTQVFSCAALVQGN